MALSVSVDCDRRDLAAHVHNVVSTLPTWFHWIDPGDSTPDILAIDGRDGGWLERAQELVHSTGIRALVIRSPTFAPPAVVRTLRDTATAHGVSVALDYAFSDHSSFRKLGTKLRSDARQASIIECVTFIETQRRIGSEGIDPEPSDLDAAIVEQLVTLSRILPIRSLHFRVSISTHELLLVSQLSDKRSLCVVAVLAPRANSGIEIRLKGPECGWEIIGRGGTTATHLRLQRTATVKCEVFPATYESSSRNRWSSLANSITQAPNVADLLRLEHVSRALTGLSTHQK